MNTQHTPGKWVAHGCTVATADNWKDGNNLGGATVAITYQPDADTCPCDEMLANARLIAAAPELLAACDNLLAQVEYLQTKLSVLNKRFTEPTTRAALEEGRAAIAAATGKE